MKRSDFLKATALAAAMGGVSLLAVAAAPRKYLADELGRETLKSLIPRSFGEWSVDESIVPVPPSPDLQAVIDQTYDETLALTYRNPDGERIMLSVAYGRNQHKGMNTHRPDVCYPAQGFKVTTPTFSSTVANGAATIPVHRLVAELGARVEPITYWLLVGDQITDFGYAQRRVTISYGLRGDIPDGVLFRVSSIDKSQERAFALQDRFIKQILAAVPSARRGRLIGSLAESTPAG